MSVSYVLVRRVCRDWCLVLCMLGICWMLLVSFCGVNMWFRSRPGLRSAREPGGPLDGKESTQVFPFVSHVCVRCFVGIYVLLLCIVNCAIPVSYTHL